MEEEGVWNFLYKLEGGVCVSVWLRKGKIKLYLKVKFCELIVYVILNFCGFLWILRDIFLSEKWNIILEELFF